MAGSLLIVLLLAFVPVRLQAQSSPAALETLDVGLSLLGDVSRGLLHRWWSPGPAVALGLATPFHVGDAELGFQYAHPSAHRDDVPGFRSLFVYAGWSGRQRLGRGFSAGGGLRAGIMAMRFEGDTLPAFRARESELGVAARAVLRYMPAGTWFAESSLSYQSVLTSPHIEQVFLSVGIGRRFGTPAWLRDFLD